MNLPLLRQPAEGDTKHSPCFSNSLINIVVAEIRKWEFMTEGSAPPWRGELSEQNDLRNWGGLLTNERNDEVRLFLLFPKKKE